MIEINRSERSIQKQQNNTWVIITEWHI